MGGSAAEGGAQSAQQTVAVASPSPGAGKKKKLTPAAATKSDAADLDLGLDVKHSTVLRRVLFHETGLTAATDGGAALYTVHPGSRLVNSLHKL